MLFPSRSKAGGRIIPCPIISDAPQLQSLRLQHARALPYTARGLDGDEARRNLSRPAQEPSRLDCSHEHLKGCLCSASFLALIQHPEADEPTEESYEAR